MGAPIKEAAPAYHVLMRAALEGELSAFVSTPELTELWRIWTPLLDAYDKGKAGQPRVYRVGSSRGAWHAQEPGAGHDDL